MKMPMRTLFAIAPYLLIVCAFLLLTTEFYNNGLRIVQKDFFDGFQKDSESLVVGRLVRSKKDGPFSHGGFLGWNHPFQPGWPKDSTPPHLRFDGWGYEVPGFPSKYYYQYDALKSNLRVDNYEIYFSQTGGQTFVYYLLSTVFPIAPENLVNYFRAFNAVLTSSMLCLFLAWAYRNFGLLPSVICFIVLVLSQWLIVFADNLLYVTGLFYLPLVCNLLFLDYCSKNKRKRPGHVLLLTFITVFTKCMLAGFDFIIPTLVMAGIPVILYGYWGNWSNKELGILFIGNVVLSLLAVITAIVLLATQLALFYHSPQMALAYLVDTSERRTYGNHAGLQNVFDISRKYRLLDVWNIYTNAIVINMENLNFPVILKVKHFLWVFFLAALFVPYSVDHYKKTLTGLLMATGISLMGPLGWFIIFKFHAISHTHMNFIIWYMPTILFGTLLIGCVLKMGVEWHFRKENLQMK